jgi:hypothetical protein
MTSASTIEANLSGEMPTKSMSTNNKGKYVHQMPTKSTPSRANDKISQILYLIVLTKDDSLMKIQSTRFFFVLLSNLAS